MITTDKPAYDDRTCIESADGGDLILVDLHEATQELIFRHEHGDEQEILRCSYDALTTIRDTLTLDADAGLFVDAPVIRELQAWANVDAIGQQLRAAQQ